MTAADFRNQFASYLGLLAYARSTNDLGGVARCERELDRLAEAGARGVNGGTDGTTHTTAEENVMTADDPTEVLSNPTATPTPPAAAAVTAFDAMTLRDWFAGQALAGIFAAHTGETALPEDDRAAKWAYQAADAMLARRSAPTA